MICRKCVLVAVTLIVATLALALTVPSSVLANPNGVASLWSQRGYNAAHEGHVTKESANISIPSIVNRWFSAGTPEDGAAMVGNLDSDDALEQVGLDGGAVVALKRDLSVLWTSQDIGAERLWQVVDLDGDQSNEVLVSNRGTMYVLSGQSGEALFEFGFNTPSMKLEDLDDNGSLEILVQNGAQNPGLRAYTFENGIAQGQLMWQSLAGIPAGQLEMTVGDLDGRDGFEVIIDDLSGGRVLVLNATNGNLLRHRDERTIEGDSGCGRAVVANTDGDDQNEFIFSGSRAGSGQNGPVSAFVAVYDYVEDAIEWSYEYGNGGDSEKAAFVAGVTDLNGDDNPEVVVSVFDNDLEVVEGGGEEDLDGVSEPGVWSLIVYDGATGDTIDHRTGLVATAVMNLGDGTPVLLAQTSGDSRPLPEASDLVAMTLPSDTDNLTEIWRISQGRLMAVNPREAATCERKDSLPNLAMSDLNDDGIPEMLVTRQLDTSGGPAALQLFGLGRGTPRVLAQLDLADHHRPKVVEMGTNGAGEPLVALQLGDGFMTTFDGSLEQTSRTPLSNHMAEPRIVRGVDEESEEFRRVMVQAGTGAMQMLNLVSEGLRPLLNIVGGPETLPQPQVALDIVGQSAALHITTTEEGDTRLEVVDIVDGVVWTRDFVGTQDLPGGFLIGEFDSDKVEDFIYFAPDAVTGFNLELVNVTNKEDDPTHVKASVPLLDLGDDVNLDTNIGTVSQGREDPSDFMLITESRIIILEPENLTATGSIDIGPGARHSVAGNFNAEDGDEVFVNASSGAKQLVSLDENNFGDVLWEIPITGDDHTYQGVQLDYPGLVTTSTFNRFDIALAGRAGDLTLHSALDGTPLWRVCLSDGQAVFMDHEVAPTIDQCEGGMMSDITTGNMIVDADDPLDETDEILVGGEDGWLYMLNAEDGSMEWSMDFGAPLGPTLLTDPYGAQVFLSLIVTTATGDIYTMRQGFSAVSEVRDVLVVDDEIADPNTDADEIETAQALGVSWEPVLNAEGYRLAIISDGGPAMPFQDVGQNTAAIVNDLNLEIGRTYTAMVVAYNEDGVQSSPTRSDGLSIVDLTAPDIFDFNTDTPAFNPLRDPPANLTAIIEDNRSLRRARLSAKRAQDDEPQWTRTIQTGGDSSIEIDEAWDGRAGDELVPDGLYTVTLTVEDFGDNETQARVEVLIDANAPRAPIVLTPEDGDALSQSAVTISGEAEGLSTVEVLIDETVVCTEVASEDGSFSCETEVEDGEHSIQASATDALDNKSELSEAVVIIVDTVAPEAPVITSPEDAEVLTTSSPDVVGTAEAASTVTVTFDDGSQACSAEADDEGNFSCTVESALEAGTYTVSATATDTSGLVSEASEQVSFTVEEGGDAEPDATPDANPDANPDADPGANPDASPDVTGNVDEGCGCSVPTSPAPTSWPILAMAMVLGLFFVRRRD